MVVGYIIIVSGSAALAKQVRFSGGDNKVHRQIHTFLTPSQPRRSYQEQKYEENNEV